MFQIPLQSDKEISSIFGSVQVNVHRGELQTALLKLYNKNVHTGYSFERYEEDASGVTVYFKNGKVVRGGYLVGADGAHSPVRRIMHPNHRLRYSGYTCWRGLTDNMDLHRSNVLPDGYMFKTVMHDESGISLTGGTLGRHRKFWALDVYYPEKTDGPLELKPYLLGKLKTTNSAMSDIVRATDEKDIIKTDIYDTSPLPFYSTRRVVLIGDAAHPMVHHFGQGSCLALEDAVRLAKELHDAQLGDIVTDFSAAISKFTRVKATMRSTALVYISRLCGDFYLRNNTITNSILWIAFAWPISLIFVWTMKFLLFYLNKDLRVFAKAKLQPK
jgi:2-polyprenyl-6-methoxyphenol hydroxylase-like FAD-dependent oxidoreductase